MGFFNTDLDPIMIGAVVVLSLWQFGIKGLALWRSSQLKQKNWFVALFLLLPLNDLAIIELIYLFRFAKKRLTLNEVKSWFKK